MAIKLTGPFDEHFEISGGTDAGGGSGGLFAARDSELLARMLERFLEDPLQQHRVRMALGPSYEGPWDPASLRAEVARRLAREGVAFRYLPEARRIGQLPGVRVGGSGEIIDVRAPEQKTEALIRDWRIECHHHTEADARALIERGTLIQVVPEERERSDEVKIHYRDDYDPPPPALRSGAEEVPKTGGSGGYDVYTLDAEYKGDLEPDNFLAPSFWNAYLHKDNYTVTGTPQAVRVEVFHPRHFKLEVKFPPLKSVKAGAKLQKDVEVQGRRLVTKGETELDWKIESTSWSPSSLKVNTTKASSEKPPESDPPKSAVIKAIEFEINGSKQSLEIIEYIGALLNFYTACMEIVDAIKENAPKVGWYVDFNLQLMQGGAAIEWYWKEHTDHRVFQYVDFNISLTIFSITFELGIGISGLGFKAQVFAQVSGELTVSANARRDGPDGAPGFAIPTKGTIKGALGARFEAGNLFKAEGKGETGIEVLVELGINRGRSKMMSFDLVANWTGIKVIATVSGGLFGLGREKKWERVLVQPKRLGGVEWPKPEPFSPPYVSRDNIKRVVEGVVTDGFNVRVIRPVEGMFSSDVHWTPSQIADALADKIDRHRTFHRTPKMVEGLAQSIRQDLDRLGARFGRDYIDESAFLRYVHGGEIPAHQDKMVNPAAAIAAAAS